MTDLVPDLDAMIAWEQGDLDAAGVLILFSNLVHSGLAWSLQGMYGRAAADLIENGFLTRTGEFTDKGLEVLRDH